MLIGRIKSEILERSKTIKADFYRRYDRAVLRPRLFEKQSGLCAICGKLMQTSDSIFTHIDHATSVYEFASYHLPIEEVLRWVNEEANLRAVHLVCNTVKRECDLEYFLEQIASGERSLGKSGMATSEEIERWKEEDFARRSAASKKRNETLGPDGRSAAVKKGRETLGPEGRSAVTKKAKETMGHERLSAAAKKASRKGKETLGPEGRSAAMKKRSETLGPDGRSAAIKKGKETMGHERLSAAARKARETVRRNKGLPPLTPPEQLLSSICELRASGLTQRSIAAQLGISQSYVSKLLKVAGIKRKIAA